MKKIISTPHAPAAIGPYSQAVLAGGVLYTAGQIAIVPETGELDLKQYNCRNASSNEKPRVCIVSCRNGFF